MLTFRNSRGELTDVPVVAATKAKNEFGAVLEQALATGAVAITRHDTPKAVLMSYAEFSSLVKTRTSDLDDLAAQFDDLLARMQTPAAREGVAAAFRASPADLGRAAAAAAVPPRARAARRRVRGRVTARRHARSSAS